ncbi:hypothetical protein KA977_01790 [Candidatus Dependentiae bacterium]|nr:hypothetical protein [Candidatus Dependentiae bacterium]
MNFIKKPFILIFFITLAVYAPLFKNINLFGIEDIILFINIPANTFRFHDLFKYFIGEHLYGITNEYEFFRPAISLFYFFHYSFFGINASVLHFNSLIIFLLSASILYCISNSITKSDFISYVSAILFILFPSIIPHSSFIALDSGELLALFFILLTLYLYIKNINCIIIIFSAFCAYCSKETTYILPMILFLYDLIIKKQKLNKIFKKNFILIGFSTIFFLYRFMLFNGASKHGYPHSKNNILLIFFDKLSALLNSYNCKSILIIFIFLIFLYLIKKNKSFKFIRIITFYLIWLLFTIIPIISRSIKEIDNIHYLFSPALPFVMLISIFFWFLYIASYKNKTICILIILFLGIIYFINIKNSFLWNNIAVLRNNIAYNAKNEILKNSAKNNIIIIKNYFIGGFNILTSIENNISLLLDGTDKKTCFNMSYEKINNPDAAVFIISNNVKKINRAEMINHYYDSPQFKTINKFTEDKNYKLSDSEIFSFLSDDYFCFHKYNPAVDHFIKNDTVLANDSSDYKNLVELIEFIYFKKFNSKYWIKRLTDKNIEKNDTIILSSILYYSIILDYNIFNIEELTLLYTLKNQHIIPQPLIFFISSILFKKNLIQYNELISSVPDLNNIDIYFFKKMILNISVFINSKDCGMADYILNKKFSINNFNDFLFWGHFKLKKNIKNSGYLNPFSFNIL